MTTRFLRSTDTNYIGISGQLKYETDKAILLFDGAKEVWIPKSQIQNPEDMDQGKGAIEVIIPEWLAIEKGLI